MNLRRALEKARQMRGEGTVQPLVTGKPLFIRKSPEKDWKPPEYTQSRSLTLDKDRMTQKGFVCIDPSSAELEAYKVLRTRIQMAIGEKQWNTILITSPNPGEGKTLTAINLALTFAHSYNQTVLLLDCDLRRQNIHRVLELESQGGIVDYLINDKPLKDFIIWPGIEKLTLISGGPVIQNSAEILGSDRMQALLSEMKQRYADRVLLIDSPPVLTGADTLALAPQVDCFLMVVQEGRTRMREVKKALEVLPSEKFLGFVLNMQKKSPSPYSYSY
ncbi:MAG: CpsD/CapB family tyrosine-protein kinase [candidate division WOR-3 bacterium]